MTSGPKAGFPPPHSQWKLVTAKLPVNGAVIKWLSSVAKPFLYVLFFGATLVVLHDAAVMLAGRGGALVCSEPTNNGYKNHSSSREVADPTPVTLLSARRETHRYSV